MKIIDMNAQALANTARELIERLPKMKMADALAHWNLCVEQSGFAGTYGFPVVGYTRKSGIILDLNRVAKQLDRIAEGCHPLTNQTFDEAHAEALVMNEEITLVRNVELMTAEQAVIDAARETDVEKAHTEALEMEAARNLNARQARFVFHNAAAERAEAIEAAHAEALDINAAIDSMIDEREHVANCSYEGFQEQSRVNQIGRGEALGIPERLGDMFADVRRLAIRLWENGFVTYPPEECGVDYVAACIECRAQWVHFS